jgi:hypothetical protein
VHVLVLVVLLDTRGLYSIRRRRTSFEDEHENDEEDDLSRAGLRARRVQMIAIF